ncbi:ATP-binding protein [Sphingomonas sp. TREG-RG-20F-R18-01]|uniref:ATP-binding protein n=1 Tax=Sphingomonas sp. TREG-RG-20F-R18-01 TaxID=2914982 RepID=UPI001F58202F|nr:ATP-binding protein [Sphingomonas sp. TREG-RG-20F-R18-01]
MPVRPDPLRYLGLALPGPLLLAIMAAGLQHQYALSETLRHEARASFERRAIATTLIPRMADAESGQRGFIITGDDRFLQGYAPARAAVFAGFAALERDLAADPRQFARLRTMRVLAVRKFAEMDAVIAARRRNGLRGAAPLVERGDGAAVMQRMRALSAEIVQAAGVARDNSVAAFQRRTNANLRSIWVGIATMGLIVLAIAAAFWRQSMARYNARCEAFENAERNRTILDSTIDAIAIIDPVGTIETINRAASELLGYPPHELVGRNVTTVLRIDDTSLPLHERVRMVGGRLEQPYRPDRTLLHRDGHEVSVDVALGVIHLPDGPHIVVSARDVSERRRVERLKDALMSTVSHELRTPLTSVVGALGLLRAGSAGPLPDQATRLIEIAENNSRRLIRLINDMLDIDRIQSGMLHLARMPIDLADVVDRAAVGSQGLGVAESVHIASTLPNGEVPVLGDPDRLLQVITNLVSNAVRASPTGGVVRIGLTRSEAGGKAIVTVDDEGPGVPSAFRTRIFGRFERADGEQGVGTGLGLAISREIIARHDGRIWFEDRPGGGSRFAFALDLQRKAVPLVEPSPAPCVLICEDDVDMACALETMVADLGYRAERVGTVEAARAALARRGFAALLLDVERADESGWALVEGLRAADGAAVPPIIVVAARDPEALADPIADELLDWLVKPVDPQRLGRAIETATRRSGGTRATILHVDDDPDVLSVAETALHRDARILKATDLATARALLETERPDIAILDLHLPEGSGLQLLPMLIDADGLAIPTIIFSAHEIAPDAAGMVDAVLVKSRESLPDLTATVRRILAARGRQ